MPGEKRPEPSPEQRKRPQKPDSESSPDADASEANGSLSAGQRPTGGEDDGIRLLFEPDRRRIARFKAVRTIITFIALLIVGSAFVLVVTYRPAITVGPVVSTDTLPTGAVPEVRPEDIRPEAPAVQDPAVGPIRKIAADVSSRTRSIQRFARQFEQVLPRPPFEKEAIVSAMETIGEAQSLNDSIARMAREFSDWSRLLNEYGRELGASQRYEVSILVDELERTQADLDAQVQDMRTATDYLVRAVSAIADDADTEAEIRTQLATSYRLRVESRNRTLQRRLDGLQAAAQRLQERLARS